MDKELNWNDILKKQARGIDDLDLGEIQVISEDEITVQKGNK